MISVLTFGNQADAPLGFTDAIAIQDWLSGGDDTAATWLYEKYFPLVLHVCSRRLPRLWMAEDAAQATMSRAFFSLHLFETERRFSSWITCIATRECVDVLRTLGRRREVAWAELDESARLHIEPSASESPDREQAELVRSLIESLSPEVRTVVELHYLEGFTAREIAKRQGLSPANVAIRLMRARQHLAACAGALDAR